MEIPKTARYRFATNTAYEFLIDNKISFIPSIIDLAKSKGFIVLSFKELCESIGWDDEALNKLRQRGSAISSKIHGVYHIWYNELSKYNKPKSIGELRFDLAHELGHIELGHLRDFLLPTDKLSGSIALENEANCFARNLIEPVQFISIPKLKKYVDEDYAAQIVSSLFHVTLKAALVRCQDWIIKSDLGYILKDNRRRIIDILTPMRNWIKFYKKCKQCNYESIDEKVNYCPICGNNNFEIYGLNNFLRIHTQRGKNIMIYPGYEVDENGKATICPRCDNEEIVDGEFCKICGTHIVNRCTNTEGTNFKEPCGITVDGNARYCPKCGSETTFFQDKLLKPWGVIRKENNTEDSDHQNEAAAPSQPAFEDPFAENDKPVDISDEDLPF